MEPAVPREAGYLDVDGGQLYFETAGAGYPVLLIHADVADCRMWDAQFDAFARQYHVIRYNKRGFGKTTSVDGAFSHRQDIVSLLRHLGVVSAAVVGLSNGGRLALDFTMEHPKLVDALVVASGGISGQQPSATEDEMRLFGTYAGLQEQQDFDALIALGVHVWADGPAQREGRADPHVRESLRKMLANNYRLHHEHLQPLELEPPAIGRLDEVRAPTLVIAGALDFSGTIAAMELLARGIAGARYIVFPNAAHMVNMEQPERFNALTLDLFASVL